MKYTEIKQILDLKPLNKSIDDNAFITHFLQNPNSKNRINEIAKTIIAERSESIEKIIKDIEWDIPFPFPENTNFSFIDLFAGIGGFRMALQNLGGKCVFSSEIDNSVKVTYEKNYGEFPFGDIKEFTGPNVSDDLLNKLIPDHNVLAAGFPCQPFSLAGVSARISLGQEHGFLDKIKGNLFFDIARIVSIKQPEVIFLENVKNFHNHDEGNTFRTVKTTIEGLGYKLFSAIINSEQLVPQSRRRFYMIGIRNDLLIRGDYTFPEFNGEPLKLRDFLEPNVPDIYTISDKLWNGHKNRTQRNIERGTGFTAHVADLDKPSKTLVARYGKDGKECLIPQDGQNPRKLTPRECARLQGFPEEFTLPVSRAAAYHQFGNSVSVPVIQAIAENFINYLIE